jgi:hypothetical protein
MPWIDTGPVMFRTQTRSLMFTTDSSTAQLARTPHRPRSCEGTRARGVQAPLRGLLLAAAIAVGAFTAPAAFAAKTQGKSPKDHNYPTADRVVYVQACMRDHPGNNHEMVTKCSCAIDRIAAEMPYDRFTDLHTASQALGIGGERGSTLRDSEDVQKLVRRWRELQTKVKKSCFVIPE